jgi:hypothetical protein
MLYRYIYVIFFSSHGQRTSELLVSLTVCNQSYLTFSYLSPDLLLLLNSDHLQQVEDYVRGGS